MALNNPDITSFKIYSDQNDDRYYVGENAIIRAHIENRSAVKAMTWHWKKKWPFYMYRHDEGKVFRN